MDGFQAKTKELNVTYLIMTKQHKVHINDKQISWPNIVYRRQSQMS